jgi:hypothetical protein
MDIGTAIEKFGFPLAAFIGIALSWDRKIWPFIVAQITGWQADRKAERDAVAADRTHERDAFIANLAALQQTASAAHLARAEHDRIIAEQIEAMAKAVQQVAVLVQHNYDALHLTTPRARKHRAPVIN